ncbi:MAG: cytochrome ubiquinol oxidase subunit I [Candidatus Sumerlaeia bacterium]|nr:cytochrome ubiquinol oxidase subunit I [Candidatus Sumerlaeia bacterium]
MDLDVVLLSRIQFALTIAFHYLYPPLSIGLGVLLVVMEGMYLKTGNPLYHKMTKFWVKIFGLTFGLGVASGIVMEFEFGTNWATYSRFVGDVFGSALAAEGIFAFFLESGFLAVLLFGWDKVSKKMHFFSTLMVSLGSMFSAVWIVVANSWQQTPTGFHIVGEGLDARAEITDFWAMVFNPSSMARLSHVLLGAYIQGAFLVLSIAAWYLLKNRHHEFAKKSFVIALALAAVASTAQPLVGHWSAMIVAEHQPAKLAAFEGVYKTEESTPLYLFGIPNNETETVAGIAVPGMLSFLVHGDFTTPVTGLDQFAPEDRPPVHLPFQTYHIMIALGMFFIGITWLAFFMLWRGKLFETRWLLWVFVFSVVAPFVANQAGWFAAEVGRQPWIVYGLLRTSDGVSKAVQANAVLTSLIMFTLIYALLFAMFLYLLDRKIKAGPDVEEYSVAPEESNLAEAVTARKHGGGAMLDVGDQGKEV